MAKVSLESIQKLRKITGLGMLDCKKALDQSSGDIEKAIEELELPQLMPTSQYIPRQQIPDFVDRIKLNEGGTSGIELPNKYSWQTIELPDGYSCLKNRAPRWLFLAENRAPRWLFLAQNKTSRCLFLAKNRASRCLFLAENRAPRWLFLAENRASRWLFWLQE